MPFVKHQVAGVAANYDAAYWHQDRNFGTSPAKATVLQCHEAPAAGGETPLLDGVATLAALGEATHETLRSWRGIYEFGEIAETEDERQYSDPEDLKRLKDFTESVVLTHPVTGRESIGLSERYVRFDDEENAINPGRPRLETLREIIENGVVYRHQWKVGDVLIWDNFATLHRSDPIVGATKVTHRIVVT
jgi:alpha-ketoglutarate-dependent taurine dioxygenase